jgi:hypothetical protein
MRTGDKRFGYTFLAQLYNTAGQHFGYSLVRGYIVMETKDLVRAEGEVFVYFGTDLENPSSVIRLGAETSVGRRIVPPGH